MEPLFVYGVTKDNGGQLVKFGPFTSVVMSQPDRRMENDYTIVAHLVTWPGQRVLAKLHHTEGWKIAGVDFKAVEVTTYDDGSPPGGIS